MVYWIPTYRDSGSVLIDIGGESQLTPHVTVYVYVTVFGASWFKSNGGACESQLTSPVCSPPRLGGDVRPWLGSGVYGNKP